jgi:hypothetical protein
MPIDFPLNPSQNQTYSFNDMTWTFIGNSWKKVTSQSTGGAAPVTVSNSAPVSATEGALWLSNETGDLGIYFANSWAAVSGTVGPTGATGATGPSGTGGTSGGVTWANVQTASFTANVGTGYAVNTTAGAITMTLPASPAAGDVVTVTDYAGTFNTNYLTINPNGNKINGSISSVVLPNQNNSAGFVYIDTTQGWKTYSYSSVLY